MIVPRREFLKMLGVAAGAAGLGGCDRRWLIPDSLVEEALRGPGLESQLQTICGLCAAGCGVTVRQVDGLPVGLKGNPNHPLNRGGLCPVGQAGLEVLYSPDRLQGPLRRRPQGGFEAVSWEEALGEIGGRLRALQEAGEGSRIALLTEEPGELFGGLADRFVRSLGSRSFAQLGGLPTVPFELAQGVTEPIGFDLANTDLVLSFGLDLYEDGPAPLHVTSAMIGGRSTESRAGHIHVGTRLSPSAAKADRYVSVRPGSHAAFALGVAHVLVREGRFDREFVGERTFGFEDWTDAGGRRRKGYRSLLLERYYPDHAAQLCGCEPAILVNVARSFAAASRPLAIAGGEALSASNATWTALAVHSLNALLGAFDREGGVAMPQPIPLAALPAMAESEAVAAPALWDPQGSQGRLGGDPVGALADRVLAEEGAVQALLLVNTNPVHSSPAGERLLAALERIPTVVALSSFQDETCAGADFILPTHVFLEAWQGATTPALVAFSALGIGQPAIAPLHDTRHPGDILLELAKLAGDGPAEALPWADYETYLKQRLEGLVVSGEGSVVTGSFEESWVHFLEERGWRFLEHRSLERLWTALLRESGWWNPVNPRGDWARLFRTPSGRFEFASQILERRVGDLERRAGEAMPGESATDRGRSPLGLESDADEAALPHFEPPVIEGDGELVLVPFRPITARGRLGPASPMVMEMYGYPLLTEWRTWVELAPETAHELHLEDGDEVAVESERATFEAIVRIQPGNSPGVAHVPLGLGHRREFGAGGAVGANPLTALLPVEDPLSGSLSSVSTRVSLRLVRRRPHGGPLPLQGGHGA